MKLLRLVLSVVVVFLLLLQHARAARKCCPGLSFCFTDDPPFDSPFLPLPGCAEEQDIVMRVYTRNNTEDGQPITRNSVPPVFNGNLSSMFIVHGFMSNENATWLHSAKNASLLQGDYNVIIVGWSKGSGTHLSDYHQSASNTRAVGAEIALVSNLTIQTRGSSRTRQYCVGHSLGAHVCGHAGHYGQFGRITGLDPAGPGFHLWPPSAGLDETSADLVDVIHTDSRSAGHLMPLGHIDFYPNGGSQQPGCNKIGCSHMRVVDLFIESILKDCFVSRCVCTDPKVLPGSCKSNGTVLQSLGFPANTYPGRGIFYLKTKSHQPFCQSAVAPLMQRCRLVCFAVSSMLLKLFLNSL